MKKIFPWAAVVVGAAILWFCQPPYTRLWQFPSDWWRVLGMVAGIVLIIIGGAWIVLLGWGNYTEKYEKHGR